VGSEVQIYPYAPTALVRLPQFPPQSTTGFFTVTCPNLYWRSISLQFEGETILTLLVCDFDPPIPSTCRQSGEPNNSRSSSSRRSPGGGDPSSGTKPITGSTPNAPPRQGIVRQGLVWSIVAIMMAEALEPAARAGQTAPPERVKAVAPHY